jgi:hypothetical protein
MSTILHGILALAVAQPGPMPPGRLVANVSWLGNSFSGAGGKWAQNFFIHANVKPDGSVITWSQLPKVMEDDVTARAATLPRIEEDPTDFR